MKKISTQIFFTAIVFVLIILFIYYRSLSQANEGALYIESWGEHIKSFFSLSIPFLLVTIGFPSVCILLILRRSPIEQYRTSITQAGISREVFRICLLFFIVLQAYGIYYYKLRLQWEGAGDMIYYVSNDIFHASIVEEYKLRFPYLFNKILMSPSAMLHLPLTAIGIIYILNDTLFHLFISLAIIFFTRRYDLAAVVLAAPILILGMNYYFICCELFLSGSIMILYVAVYIGMKDSAVRNLILFPCLFFIIWSHPINMIMLAVFLAGMYKSKAQLIKDKWILSFILLNGVVRLLLLTGYDYVHIHELEGHISFNQFGLVILAYGQAYWYLIILTVIGVYISLSRHKSISDYAGLILLPLILYFCTVRSLYDDKEDFPKFTYPINLFILMQGVVLVSRYATPRYKKLILAGAFIILSSGIYNILQFHTFFKDRVVLIETLNKICFKQDPNQSKWFIPRVC